YSVLDTSRPPARAHPHPAISGRHARPDVLGVLRTVPRDRLGHDRLRHRAPAPAGPRFQAPSGPLLPFLRAVAGPVRPLLRGGSRASPLPAIRRAPRPDRPDVSLRLDSGPALRHQRYRLRAGGVPPRGGPSVVGAVVARRLGARTDIPCSRAGGGRSPKPPP